MGKPGDWANESFQLAGREIYRNVTMAPGSEGQPVILPRDYAERESAIVSAQIEKAGVRLAAALNDALR